MSTERDDKFTKSPNQPFVSDPIYRFISKVSPFRVWITSLVVYVAIYILVGFSVDYFHRGENYLSIRDLAEVVNGISVWVIFVPTAWSYYRWLPELVLKNIEYLEAKEIIASKTRNDHDQALLSLDLRKSLGSKWVYTLAVLAAIVSYLYLIFVVVPFQNIRLGKIDFWYYTKGSMIVFSILYISANYIFLFSRSEYL